MPTVAELMTRNVVTVRGGATLAEALTYLATQHISGAAVTDPGSDWSASSRRKLADPAAFVQPRIGDFLYDTAIAFSGRDSGVFVPSSALARVFKMLESLASYLLFGVVVSRAATAAGSRLGHPA